MKITKKQINENTKVVRGNGFNPSYSFSFNFEGRNFQANRNLPGTVEFKDYGGGVSCGSGDTKKEFVNSVYEAINN